MIGRSGGSEVDNIFKALNYQRNERRSQLEGVTGEAFLFKDGRDLGMFICWRQKVVMKPGEAEDTGGKP